MERATGSGSPVLQAQPIGPFAQRVRSRFDAQMADNRTIFQLDDETIMMRVTVIGENGKKPPPGRER
jgi:hypothetical protein